MDTQTGRGAARSGRSGFTLVETMVASALSLLLALTIFETASFSARAAYDIKSRLAADAIAFDTVWELYNRPLAWLENQGALPASGWVPLGPAPALRGLRRRQGGQ